QTHEDVEKKVRIPDVYSFFRIASVEGTIVRTDDGEPEQVIVVNTTSAAKPEEVARSLRIFLLPPKKQDEKPVPWETAEEVDESVLREATQLPFKPVPGTKEFSS